MNGARVFQHEKKHLAPDYNPGIRVEEKQDAVYLSMEIKKPVLEMQNPLVTTELLGKAIVSDQEFTNPDGSEIIINKDFFGKKRNERNPVPGPFENPAEGKVELKVWEK